MRATLLVTLVSVTIAFSGCGGGTVRGVTMDKTISHSGGIFNISQTKHISSKLEARSGNGNWEDLTALKGNDLEAWYKGKSGVEARSFIQFDDFQLPLESKAVKNAGDLKDMQGYLASRMKDVDSFMKNNNKQLDARKW